MSFTIFQNETTALQAIKTRSSKTRKIDIFPKGLTHGFGPKITIFPSLYLGNIGQENVFYDIPEGKTPLQFIKTSSLKGRKIYIFPKELTRAFGPKLAIFLTFFFQAIQARKMSLTIFQNKKNTFIDYNNKKFKQSKNSHFFKGFNPRFCSNNANFSNFLFQEIQARKMSFTTFQNEKTPFQAIKTKRLKRRKIDIFQRGKPMVVVQKWQFFQLLFFSQYRPRKSLLRYSRRKNRL